MAVVSLPLLYRDIGFEVFVVNLPVPYPDRGEGEGRTVGKYRLEASNIAINLALYAINGTRGHDL